MFTVAIMDLQLKEKRFVLIKKKRNTVIFMLTYLTGIVELKKWRKGEEVVQISVNIDEQVHEVWLPRSGSFFFYHNHLGRPFFYQVFYNAPYHLQ